MSSLLYLFNSKYYLSFYHQGLKRAQDNLTKNKQIKMNKKAKIKIKNPFKSSLFLKKKKKPGYFLHILPLCNFIFVPMTSRSISNKSLLFFHDLRKIMKSIYSFNKKIYLVHIKIQVTGIQQGTKKIKITTFMGSIDFCLPASMSLSITSLYSVIQLCYFIAQKYLMALNFYQIRNKV